MSGNTKSKHFCVYMTVWGKKSDYDHTHVACMCISHGAHSCLKRGNLHAALDKVKWWLFLISALLFVKN